jgi:hypothetical protein
MPEYVTLLGAEDVQRASHNIRNAAEQMSAAARQMWEANKVQQEFLNEWLERFKAAFKEAENGRD